MLHVVTCHFNPCRYHRLLDNYRRFRDALSLPVTTVELSFTDEFEIPDAIHVRGDLSRHNMWQKERLLNIGLASLPATVDKFAWIDADVLFDNPDWSYQAEQMLDEYPVIQLFDRVHLLDESGRPMSSHPSWIKAVREGRANGAVAKPGFAWAARRETLKDSLFDRDVIGGGDSSMVYAWYGEWNGYLVKRQTEPWREAFLDWGRPQYDIVQGRLSYVHGDIRHMFHGHLKNRQYVDRLAYLVDHDFDPMSDIALDDNGLWRWNSDKPEMHRQVAEYFRIRNDDETQANEPIVVPTATRRHVTRWSVAVTTAPRQEPTLERTLSSLDEAGWRLLNPERDFEVRIFAEPGTQIPARFQHLPITAHDRTLGAFPNWYLGLTEMVLRDPKAQAYLMIQDDVLFSKGLREYLEERLWPGEEVGVVSAYCPSHYCQGRSPGFHVEDRGWRSWGALAYIFSNVSARLLLADVGVLEHRGFGPREGLKNVDSVVGRFCKQNELPYYVHSPSLAQHIGDTSTLWQRGSAKGRRAASTFVPEVPTS